jgi:tRNA (guanine-N7-)-methyltransferase
MTTDSGPHPRIRSYVLRAGRVGSGQARALAEIGPQFMLPYQPAMLDLDAVFGRAAPNSHPVPRFLEIGFGMGEGLAEIASAHPENDYLGVEVHTPGVCAL